MAPVPYYNVWKGLKLIGLSEQDDGTLAGIFQTEQAGDNGQQGCKTFSNFVVPLKLTPEVEQLYKQY